MAKLPTAADGYIAAEAVEQLVDHERAWDIDDEIQSIDGDSELSDDSTSSDLTRDLQREWDENMEQGRQLFALVIFPFVGRFLGKKFSYWIWGRYLTHHFKGKALA
ncbi:hypothetical protein DFQ26_004503 [Actinomortierella ambigua]|nr:hypothetical protein DFQ26_004503 [Actinomortierella ambigua]